MVTASFWPDDRPTATGGPPCRPKQLLASARYSLVTSESWEEACASAFRDVRLSRNGRPPDTLYHYTSTDAFYKIIDSGCLWASHVRFMTDASEIVYGRELLREMLADAASHWDAEKFKQLERSVLGFSQTDSSSLTPVYALALSGKADDVAQWERYADDARGFCIGFDAQPLGVGMAKADGKSAVDRAIMEEVVYDRDRQEGRMRNIIDVAVDLVDKFGWGENQEDARSRVASLAHEMAWPVLDLLSTLKQPSYSSEQEWRLVSTTGPHVHKRNLECQFRPAFHGLVPYIELAPVEPEEQGLLPIREVITGPRQPSIEAPQATRSFLEAHEYKTYPREHIEALKKEMGDRFSSEPVSVGASELSLR